MGRIGRHVAQHALQQAQVLVQQRPRRRLEAALANPCPGLAKVGDVVRQFGVGGVFGVGAQDEAAARMHRNIASGTAAPVGDTAVGGLRSVAPIGFGGDRRLDQRIHAQAQLLAQLAAIFCEMPM